MKRKSKLPPTNTRVFILFWFATPVCPLSTYVNTPSECKRGFLHQILAPFDVLILAQTKIFSNVIVF